MQSGGRRGHRTRCFCIDGLVAGRVGGIGLMRNIRGERHTARAFDQRINIGAVMKTQFVKLACAPQHLGLGAAFQEQTHAGTRRFAGAHLCQHAGVGAIENAFDQHLDLSTALLVAGQTRINHTRVVHHQHIASLQKFRQFAKVLVG